MSLVARLHDFFEDRRLDERERVLIPAELHINDQVIRCVLLNLSTRGAMMASVNPPANGSNILMKCQDIDAPATVRWVHHYQFGLAFDHRISRREVSAVVDIAGGKGAGR
jgi:hypothetical protein